MILRRFVCSNCGAVSEDAANEVYVYCMHCDAFIDFDMQAMYRIGQSQEYQAYLNTFATNWMAKEEARKNGDRETYMKYAAADCRLSLDSMPILHPRAHTLTGKRREQYIEWTARTTTERTFNPEICKRYEDHVNNSMKFYKHTAGGPFGHITRLEGQSLITIIETWLEIGRFEYELFEELGLNTFYTEILTQEQRERPIISGMIQGYSQFLEKKDLIEVLNYFKLNGTYVWKDNPGELVCCSRCGTVMPSGEEGQTLTCPSCANELTSGAVAFSCTGCGAPLAMNADTDVVICPYCATVSNDATFQPLDYFLEWQQELDALAEEAGGRTPWSMDIDT